MQSYKSNNLQNWRHVRGKRRRSGVSHLSALRPSPVRKYLPRWIEIRHSRQYSGYRLRPCSVEKARENADDDTVREDNPTEHVSAVDTRCRDRAGKTTKRPRKGHSTIRRLAETGSSPSVAVTALVHGFR